MTSNKSVEARVDEFHARGIIDLHFDLPMQLYEKRDRVDLFAKEFLPQLEAGGIGLIGAAIYIEDRYLPDKGLQVALDQIARLYRECERNDRLTICRNYEQIVSARGSDKIGILITMEGAEPFGSDLDLVRVFYELGLRALSLTHARRNAAGQGGIFAPTGSSPEGLTPFGRELVRESEKLGIMIDLAHINPAGFCDIIELATKPVIVSHTNARKYCDIERNISDGQIKLVGERGGVIGINALLVSRTKEESTLDRYVDHIAHVADLIGIDGVGIGFDFFEFVYRQWSEAQKRELAAKLRVPHFIAELVNHADARNLTRKLIERGFADAEIEKILFRNWLRIFRQLL